MEPADVGLPEYRNHQDIRHIFLLLVYPGNDSIYQKLGHQQRLLTKVRRNQQMATNPPKRQAPKPKRSVIRWLLDSDPSIRWQVMRDLTGAPAHEVAAERARVATEGWGARLLALQGADGRWGGAAWNRGWNSTMYVLWLLRHLGLDPPSAGGRGAGGPGRGPR